MPTSVSALAFFLVLLVPGFVHLVVRREQVPTRNKSSAFIETTQVLVVSVGVAAGTFTLYGLGRVVPVIRAHTPDLAALLENPHAYVINGSNDRLAYIFGWALMLLGISCALASCLALRLGPFRLIDRTFAPAIATTPTWYVYFKEKVPEGSAVFVGCSLREGGYVWGQLDWFSTDADETADRELAVAPVAIQDKSGADVDFADVSRVILSAREIVRIDISYGPSPSAASTVGSASEPCTQTTTAFAPPEKG